MAKKKYKVKAKPKKADNGIQDVEDTEGGGLTAGQGQGLLNGATFLATNIADDMNMAHQKAGNLVQQTEVNPFQRGTGAKAAASGALAGAQAGMAFGPWGAAVGGAIGAGAGIAKGVINAQKSKEFTKALNDKHALARAQSLYKEDNYTGLKYKSGTKAMKYKCKAGTKLAKKAKDNADIEFEGGEPVFSPKKKDGTRDLIYYAPNGPKHSEGGIPANVVSKSKYKYKAGTKAVDIPEGSAIVTAKKHLGKQAVIAHKMGRPDLVEKIISKMPHDKRKKKGKGDNETDVPKTTTDTKPKTKKVSSVDNRRVTDTFDNENTFGYKDLSPEDHAKLSPYAKTHHEHQAILNAKRDALGRDLNRTDMDQAFKEYNNKYNTDYNWDKYNGSVKAFSDYDVSRGNDPLNFRGQTEGKFKGAQDDYTGIFGQRNAKARFDLSQKEVPDKTTPTPEPKELPIEKGSNQQNRVPEGIGGGMSTDADKPVKDRAGMPSLRLSDLNNMYQGVRNPDVTKYNRYNPEQYKYYDLSDPSRRYSRKMRDTQVRNAVNVSGGSAGNVRANANNSYAEDADRQQGINAFELGRFDQVKKANVDVKNNANLVNTQIGNTEVDANDANRQATRDQLQTGLVGFDENNYRNKVTNDQYNVDMQKNQIERQKLGLLKNYMPNYTNNGGIDAQYKKTYKKGTKAVSKYKKKKS